MAYILTGRVAETSTSTGTGAFTLAAAYQAPGETAVSYRRFNTVMATSDTCNYTIVGDTGAWERGIGTYSSANTLTRTTVLQSSNSNAAVSFAAGNKIVFMDQPDVPIYGQVSLGGAVGAEGLRVLTTASAVNYVSISGAITANKPTILMTGADSNVDGQYQTKGTGGHYFQSRGGSSVNFAVLDNGGNAINYIVAQGSLTTNPVALSPAGSDASIQFGISSKGTNGITFYTNSFAQVQAIVNHTASAVNYLTLTGGATTAGATLGTTGTDSAVPLFISPKGPAGFGYPTGASVGGTISQGTSRATTVTLNKPCGQITLFSTTIAALTTQTFTLNNTCISAGDVLILNHISGGTAGQYMFNAQCAANSASINVINTKNAISATEAPVIAFAVIKAAST